MNDRDSRSFRHRSDGARDGIQSFHLGSNGPFGPLRSHREGDHDNEN